MRSQFAKIRFLRLPDHCAQCLMIKVLFHFQKTGQMNVSLIDQNTTIKLYGSMREIMVFNITQHSSLVWYLYISIDLKNILLPCDTDRLVQLKLG